LFNCCGKTSAAVVAQVTGVFCQPLANYGFGDFGGQFWLTQDHHEASFALQVSNRQRPE
jgi:hypothetical protein